MADDHGKAADKTGGKHVSAVMARLVVVVSTGSQVEIPRLSETYWQKHFNGARRLVGVMPSLVPSAVAAPLSPALAGDAASLWAPLPAADGKE